MSRVLVIVGGSTTGKTALAYSLAKLTKAAAVICGDQWQMVGGFPLATGTTDATGHGDVPRELYGVLPPTSQRTWSVLEYYHQLSTVLRQYSHDFVIVDSLSLAFFPVISWLRADHQVTVIGVRPHPALIYFRVMRRMWKAWRGGAVREIRNGTKGWYCRESFVAREILARNFLLAAVRIFWTGVTGEAIWGKHRRIMASGQVDCWL